MTASLLWAWLAFCFVTSIAPGPNTLMLMNSGISFGLRRTLPFTSGVSLGFTLMLVLMGFCLVAVYALLPGMLVTVKYLGTIYVAYLALKLLRVQPMVPIAPGSLSEQPVTFQQAAAFQWIRPLTWLTALMGVATYINPDHQLRAVVLMALVFMLVSLAASSCWVLFGTAMHRALCEPWIVSVHKWVMAGLLFASLFPALWAA